MRGGNELDRGASGGQDPWLRRVQFSRGHWRREEHSGDIRSAGWWESVTVTWSPAAQPARRSPLLHRALATAVDTLTPPLAELLAARAWRLLDRWHGTHAIGPSSRRQLRTVRKALPRPTRSP